MHLKEKKKKKERIYANRKRFFENQLEVKNRKKRNWRPGLNHDPGFISLSSYTHTCPNTPQPSTTSSSNIIT